MRFMTGSRESNRRAARRDHRDLLAWQEAMKLVRLVYSSTASLPKEEMFGLSAQMRRAAVSVPSNIAEGAARGTKRELRQFLMVARGSLSEVETQVLICRDLGYLPDIALLEQAVGRVYKLSGALIQSLKHRKQEP
jgi:four helix bundle protein